MAFGGNLKNRQVKTIRSIPEMQSFSSEKAKLNTKVALVPTMGALHQGHLTLIELARKKVGPQGVVIVSIYVNPTQFGPSEDFDQYPRDFDSDHQKCVQAGVDLIFAPLDSDMYPGKSSGNYSTYVEEKSLGRTMEGESRPTHFRGVTTIVAKLFLACLPHVSVFGQKDFQQVAIIKQMVKDLNFPVEILVSPTYRESDGLAMSSRNKYLTPLQRRQAPVINTLLNEVCVRVRESHKNGKKINQADLKAFAEKYIVLQSEARLDYICGFDPNTLEPAKTLNIGHQVAIAVHFGEVRLIDNICIR